MPTESSTSRRRWDEISLPNVVHTIDDAMEMFRWLSAEPVVTFDAETTGTAVFAPDFRVRLVQFGTSTMRGSSRWTAGVG